MKPPAILAVALLAFCACRSVPDHDSSPKATSESTVTPRPPPPAPVPMPSPEVASASVPTNAPSGANAVLWEGRYEASKGTVMLPSKVKDKGLAADEGKVAAGPGTLELRIEGGGEVRGKVRGALGACSITGRVDEGILRASVLPDDPRTPLAMTGVLVGSVIGDVLRAQIRVAGPDATVVREATVELKKASPTAP